MQPQITRRDFVKEIASLSLAPLAEKVARATLQPGRPITGEKPNILIIVFDALTAKDMSLYGYPRQTTPNLERFAETATVYHKHYAASNWTTPGTASLLTGTYPWTHGVVNLSQGFENYETRQNLFGGIDSNLYHKMAYSHNPYSDLLLYQIRRDLAHYLPMDTFGLIDTSMSLQTKLAPNDQVVAYQALEQMIFRQGSQSSSPFVSWLQALTSFLSKVALTEKYRDQYPRGVPSALKMLFFLEEAIDGIITLVADAPKPFTGYFHLMPPHHPYHPRQEFISLFNRSEDAPDKPRHFFSEGLSPQELHRERRQYDEFVAYADSEFGRLYDFLERSGQLDNTYLVITSDHGEMFERGFSGHSGEMLYEPLIHIPLVISQPGQTQRRDVHTLTSCVDIVPTLTRCAGQPIPDWCEGKPLPGFGTEDNNHTRSIFAARVRKMPRGGALAKGTLAIISGDHKLIRYVGHPQYDKEYELYDLLNDPEEMEDLSISRSSVAREMAAELHAAIQRSPLEQDSVMSG